MEFTNVLIYIIIGCISVLFSLAALFRMNMNKEPLSLLILLKGYSCIGKSALSIELAKLLCDTSVLCKDDILDALLPLQQDILNINVNDYCYPILWKLADTQLRLQLNVIIDSPLGRQQLFKDCLQNIKPGIARVVLIHCIMKNNKEWERRTQKRKKEQEMMNDLYKRPTDWKKNLEYYEKTSYQIVEKETGVVQYELDMGKYGYSPRDLALEVKCWLKKKGYI
eukprot:418261_1